MPTIFGSASCVLLIICNSASLPTPAPSPLRTMSQTVLDTPTACQLHGASIERPNSSAGNSSCKRRGSERMMAASVLASLRPSGAPATLHTTLWQTYSQPMMKNGLPMSYTLIGPERMHPRLSSGPAQCGHAMPFRTSSCGSQYRKRYSGGVGAAVEDDMSEKYAGEVGSQNERKDA